MVQYGKFHDGCRDSTLPVCNFFLESPTQDGLGFGGTCQLTGIHVGNGKLVRNLGSIILAFIAILVSIFLLWRSNRKRAAVGRREMQLFLIGFMCIELCEIFSIGGFPLRKDVVVGFSAVHIAFITATTWMLMLNGMVGYQLIDDGKPLSISLIFGSAAAIFIGTGYICLDTGYDWTGFWASSRQVPFDQPNGIYNIPRYNQPPMNQIPYTENTNYAIYTLYLLVPLVFLFVYFCLETYLVLKVLGEIMPMVYLCTAVLLFAIGQIFTFLISIHICNGTDGKIDGAFFETLFTLLAVVMIWVFWSTITEDDWPEPVDSVTESADK